MCGNGKFVDASATYAKECEDGNSLNDDGCSEECTIEDGYTCTLLVAQNYHVCSILAVPVPTVSLVSHDTNTFSMKFRFSEPMKQEEILPDDIRIEFFGPNSPYLTYTESIYVSDTDLNLNYYVDPPPEGGVSESMILEFLTKA